MNDLTLKEQELKDAIDNCIDVERRIGAITVAIAAATRVGIPGENYDRILNGNSTLQGLIHEYKHLNSVRNRKRDNWKNAYNVTLRENKANGR